MKKVLFTLLSIMVIGSILLTGCGDKETVTTTATATATATVTAEPVKIVFQALDTEDSLWGDIFLPWFAEIEEVSDGLVTVETHWNGELVPMPEAYDAVVKGTLDLGIALCSVPAGMFPADEITAFAAYDVRCYRFSRLMWELHEKFPKMNEPYSDTKLLWLGATFPNALCTTAKFGPVTKLSDNQGLKEGAWGEWMAARGAALGRTAVSVLPAETYSAFEKGVADGMQCSLSLLETAHFGEVLKYILDTNGTVGVFSLQMNLDTWNKLPANVQQFIETSAGDLIDAFDVAQLEIVKYARETFPEKFGVEFVSIPADELPKWVAADQSVFDDFVASLEALGYPGTEMMAEFKALEKKYADEKYNIQ